MKPVILIAILGVVAVALAGWGMISAKEAAALRADLEAAQSALAAAKEQSPNLGGPSLEAPVEISEGKRLTAVTKSEAGDPDKDQLAALAEINSMEDLVKEARPLLKQLTPMFEGIRRNAQTQWVDRAVNRYVEKLGLTDEQTAELKQKLAAVGDAQAKKFQEALNDDTKDMTELFQGWEGQQAAFDEAIKETLTEEQYSDYSQERLGEQAQQVERRANWQLRRMTNDLELDETQQDQAFDILVRTSPGYDPTMQVEGVAATAPQLGEASRDEQIRAILTPEQLVKYGE